MNHLSPKGVPALAGDAPAPEWGVRFAASLDRAEHVDRCCDEDRACRYQHALVWCGNQDAVVVTRVSAAAPWEPVAAAVAS